ncbi:hypothetical protein GWO43_02050 [candidate division KSB1 bacterium]|nr:hypothetical protein [candidate division KSB1 bacterium]NIR69546.1 hypothetical protein [candidate division KSB1 bacterium]NIS22856.1 hypothetical protein [candidate division KSB1 bacterium]NIT69693.1 hypothetical protein [candidate division KSB1 bacterium]NIU23362.1 hypothetical protein [candidate division KSB1 bacterium]
MRIRHLLLLFLLLSILSMSVSSAQAQVTTTRSGEENPVVTIGKATLYGGATGLLLGLALTLVVDEDTGDILKWSFVGGTFGGFLFGIYHVTSRPQASAAMFQFDSRGLAKVRLPQPRVGLSKHRSLSVNVPIMSLSL